MRVCALMFYHVHHQNSRAWDGVHKGLRLVDQVTGAQAHKHTYAQTHTQHVGFCFKSRVRIAECMGTTK